MNKNAIKKFAIEARKRLRASVADQAGMLGITEAGCSEPISKNADFEIYQTAAGMEVTLDKSQCEQRQRLVEEIEKKGFDNVIEEVAYTWFNRICAIRFMEVNDYMYPERVRVLSSEKEGKNEPDALTMAPDIDWDFTEQERENIIKAKMDNCLDDLFKMLFIKQCNLLYKVLPGLFEETRDYTELLLNISFTNQDDVIRMLIDEVDEADFNVNTMDADGNPTGQVEIIGWLYQYYNTELKDDTFARLKKNIKISKERIPAATQLFTPDWIVRYMVENSVGRLWIEHLRALDESVDEKTTAENFGWKYYLPEAEQEPEVELKLAEIRTSYKDMKPEDILCIDPCMGSGHILIAMFDVLMDIYKSAGYSERDAAFLIVENNLHGLDIDRRAYQLAYFAVMMKGRGCNRRFLIGKEDEDGVRKPICPKVYAIDESNGIKREQFAYFGESLSESEKKKATEQMNGLLDQLHDATEYGSILNIDAYDWNLLRNFVADMKDVGQFDFDTVGLNETQERLWKLVEIGEVMAQKYDVVVTNPPYMGLSSGNKNLNEYVKKHYPDSKTDLFAVFIEKCGVMLKKNGYQAMITQHAWMFLSSFEKLRERLLTRDTINMIHLGARAFEEIGGEVVQTTSFVLKNGAANHYKGVYCRLLESTSQLGKEEMFLQGENRYTAAQCEFGKIPGRPVAYWVSGGIYAFFDKDKIANHFEVKAGICTGENAVYILNWQEVDWAKCSLCSSDEYLYTPHNKGGEFRKWYGNKEFVLKYNEVALVKMAQNAGFRHDGKEYYFRTHIGWSKITSYKTSFRLFEKGYTFDSAGLGLFPVGDENLYATLALLNSNVCEYLLGILNPTLNVTPMIVKLLPYDVLTVTEDFVKENISFSRTDWDSFETSWDFRRHPLVRPAPTVAEVCTVREDESEAVEISGEELDFCIFCIQMLAEHLDMPDEDVYLLLTEKTDLLDGYILRNWKVLHTKEKEYIIEELMERMQGKRGL